MKKLIVMLLLVFAGITGDSYAQDNGFPRFVKVHDSLMISAYRHKDIYSYNMYFDEFLAQYKTISVAEKKKYDGEIVSAYYNRACTYALLGDKQKALDNLEKSEFYDYDHLMADSDMEPLRKEPRFIKYLKDAKAKYPDKLTVLQQAPPYNRNEKNNLPEFTYQHSKDPNLTALKKAYNLDSIAGTGGDVLQIISLMHWVHNLITHNGSKGNPEIKNAMSLITVCKRDNKTLNCRGMAILLNEVYLAEGFSSRIVTCLPKDTADQDCHVITMVYAPTLRKWIWMDPTFNAYVMNENGELLGIGEVRERLINNKPLILNPDADHNHENGETKKDYLESYMAKNLYKLECPVRSEYNYETEEDGKERAYITLVPGNDHKQPAITKNKHGMIVYAKYYTSNPDAFWKEPPGQRKMDFETAIAKFKKFYNNNQADSICNLFSEEWGEHRKSIWTAKQLVRFKEDYGEMKSFKYMGVEPDDGVLLFKTEFTKSTHATGLSLDSEGKILTFRFKTSSSFIHELLAKNK